MGETANNEDNTNYWFFFKLLRNITDAYPIVFKSKGSNKPHSQQYRDFCSKWGNIKTMYEVCNEKADKIGEIYQMYLNDYLQYLSYLIDKAEVDRAEDEFQETIRRAKSKGRR